MLEIFSLTDLTGTLSYAIIALSYMMTRIFWLRVAAVVGLFLEIAYFRFSGGDLKVGIGWDAIFIVINLVMMFMLVRERASLRLPEKDAPKLRESFSGLDDAQIARLLKAADWRDAQPGEILTKQDHAVDSLFFLFSGRASVEVNGSFETYLEKGSFIGEIAYLTGNLATATVVIDEPSRILAFSKQRMAKITSQDSRIAGIIYELLGRDLAQKMRRSNTRRVLLQDESTCFDVVFTAICHSGESRNLSNVDGIPVFAGMTDLGVIHISMSVGHGFALGENGNAVSVARQAKGCVDASSRKNAGRVVRL